MYTQSHVRLKRYAPQRLTERTLEFDWESTFGGGPTQTASEEDQPFCDGKPVKIKDVEKCRFHVRVRVVIRSLAMLLLILKAENFYPFSAIPWFAWLFLAYGLFFGTAIYENFTSPYLVSADKSFSRVLFLVVRLIPYLIALGGIIQFAIYECDASLIPSFIKIWYYFLGSFLATLFIYLFAFFRKFTNSQNESSRYLANPELAVENTILYGCVILSFGMIAAKVDGFRTPYSWFVTILPMLLNFVISFMFRYEKAQNQFETSMWSIIIGLDLLIFTLFGFSLDRYKDNTEFHIVMALSIVQIIVCFIFFWQQSTKVGERKESTLELPSEETNVVKKD